MDLMLSWLTAILLIVLGYVSLSIMGFLSRGNNFPVEGRVSCPTFTMLQLSRLTLSRRSSLPGLLMAWARSSQSSSASAVPM